MPDILNNDELNALAAEYVLGTLDYEERKGASALLEVDHAFRGVVRIWERRFGELHLMVETVQPDPGLWERIKPKVASVEQVPVAIPPDPAVAPEEPAEAVATASDAGPPAAPPGETAPADPIAAAEAKLAELAALLPGATSAAGTGAPPAESPPAEATSAPVVETAGVPVGATSPTPVMVDDSQARPAEEIPRGFVPPLPMTPRPTPPVVQAPPIRKASRGWMAVSLAMGLVAVMLAGLISAWRFFPDELPEPLRAYSVLNIPLPPPAPPAEPAKPELPAFDE